MTKLINADSACQIRLWPRLRETSYFVLQLVGGTGGNNGSVEINLLL